jgi:hypothetical protein
MNDTDDDYLVLLRAGEELRDDSGLVLEIVPLLRTVGAIDHMRHGLCRRLLLLQRSTALICDFTPPEREDPLSDDESADLNLHLNSIYVHIRGATDNIAWALALEHGVLGEAREDDPGFQRRVGLFGRSFKDGLSNAHPGFAATLAGHLTALAELPQLRDPVAHRVPLYVVPAVLSEEQSRQHAELADQWNRAVAEGHLDKAREAMGAMGRLGVFRPMFAHSLREPLSPYHLHKRLGSDLGSLSSIIVASVQFIREQAA